jgi:hypothetical protein
MSKSFFGFEQNNVMIVAEFTSNRYTSDSPANYYYSSFPRHDKTSAIHGSPTNDEALRR